MFCKEEVKSWKNHTRGYIFLFPYLTHDKQFLLNLPDPLEQLWYHHTQEEGPCHQLSHLEELRHHSDEINYFT